MVSRRAARVEAWCKINTSSFTCLASRGKPGGHTRTGKVNRLPL